MATVVPMIAAGVLAAGAGAAMSASNKAKAPTDRNLNSEVSQNIRSQIAMQPEIYAAEAQYQPMYNELGMQNLRQNMLGTDATPGLLNLWENQIAPAASRVDATAMNAQRGSDVADWEQFAPRMNRAIDAADPQLASLREEMNRQAMAELQMGSALSPEERRQMVQASAAGQSMTGTAQAPYALYERMMSQGQLGSARQADRRAFASGVIGQNSGNTSLIASLMAQGNRNPAMSGQALMGQGSGMPTGSSSYDMFPQYASDLYGTNYNANAAALIAQYNAKQQTAAGLMNLGGSFIGGAGAFKK